MKNKILLFIFFLIFSFCGCEKSTTTQKTFSQSNVEAKKDKNTSTTKNFDFGSCKINDNETFRIKGVVSYPNDKNKYPLVLIIHGDEEINLDESYDKGFKYLSEKLANNGFVAVSIDFSKAYNSTNEEQKINEVVSSYLSLITEQNKVDKFNLSEKIDFTKIGLLGYSKGGEFVFSLADNLKNTNNKISGILSVVPTNLSLSTKLLTTDIKTSILVSELDGEVIGLDGYLIYDKLSSKKRQNSVFITLLEDANHNYYNSKTNKNDANLSYNFESDKSQLSKEEQQNFLENFSVDFFDYSLKNEDLNTLYSKDISSVNKMYNKSVKTLSTTEKSNSLVNLNDKNNFTIENLEVNLTQDALFYKDDLEYGINTPIAPDKIRKLLNIRWNNNESKFSFTPKISDFTKFDSLSIDILQDSSDKLNENKEYQSFSIVLEDKFKNKAVLDLGENLTTLKKYSGNYENTNLGDIKIKHWSRQTFLSEIKIPLSYFGEIDLKNVNKVSFLFNKTNSGAIMIDKIELK